MHIEAALQRSLPAGEIFAWGWVEYRELDLLAKKKGGDLVNRLPALREASALNKSRGSTSSRRRHFEAEDVREPVSSGEDDSLRREVL